MPQINGKNSLARALLAWLPTLKLSLPCPTQWSANAKAADPCFFESIYTSAVYAAVVSSQRGGSLLCPLSLPGFDGCKVHNLRTRATSDTGG